MPTFSCPQCGATVTASHKPSACGQCGGRQIRTNRNRSDASGNLSRAPLGRSPISGPSAPTEPNPVPLATSMGQFSVNQAAGAGLGFNLFSPYLIMTWLLVLGPVGLAMGYSFYRLANFQLVTTNASSQANQTGKDTKPTGLSPEEAIAKYYQDLNQHPDTDGWQWVFRTEIYGTKIIKAEPSHTAIQVGLRYHLHNGEAICESRVFTLTPDKKQPNWQISKPQSMRPQPNCTL